MTKSEFARHLQDGFSGDVERPLEILQTLLQNEHWQAAADIMPKVMEGVMHFRESLIVIEEPEEVDAPVVCDCKEPTAVELPPPPVEVAAEVK